MTLAVNPAEKRTVKCDRLPFVCVHHFSREESLVLRPRLKGGLEGMRVLDGVTAPRAGDVFADPVVASTGRLLPSDVGQGMLHSDHYHGSARPCNSSHRQ